jgi:hypothetical protein
MPATIKPRDGTSPTYHSARHAFVRAVYADGAPVDTYRFGRDGPLAADDVAYCGRVVRHCYPGRRVEVVVTQER